VGSDGVELGGDGHDARDSGAEDGGPGSFTSSHGLERVRGEVLDQVWVHLKAIPSLQDNFCQEGERG